MSDMVLRNRPADPRGVRRIVHAINELRHPACIPQAPSSYRLHRRFSIWAVRALLRFVASTGTASCRTEEYSDPRCAGRR
jgi:hypothetical protein